MSVIQGRQEEEEGKEYVLYQRKICVVGDTWKKNEVKLRRE